MVRLDHGQVGEDRALVEPPAEEFTHELLGRAARAAVEHASVDSPTPEDVGRGGTRTIRWGVQTEVRTLEVGSSPREAAACAAYIAKYATKSTEACGGLMHRLAARDLESLAVRPHVRRYVECAWQLATEPHLRELRLRRWAHALAFRGHCFTKSRHYSTTFTALRQARHQHVLHQLHGGERRDPWGRPISTGASRELRRFRFTGIGFKTLGDAWLAESAAARARERRRVAREELRSGLLAGNPGEDSPSIQEVCCEAGRGASGALRHCA